MMIPAWITEKLLEGVIMIVGKVLDLVLKDKCQEKEDPKD